MSDVAVCQFNENWESVFISVDDLNIKVVFNRSWYSVLDSKAHLARLGARVFIQNKEKEDTKRSFL